MSQHSKNSYHKISKVISKYFCFQSHIPEMNTGIETSAACMRISVPEHIPCRLSEANTFLTKDQLDSLSPLLSMPFPIARKCITYHIICPKPSFPRFMIIISLFLEQNSHAKFAKSNSNLGCSSLPRQSCLDNQYLFSQHFTLCNEMLLPCRVDRCLSRMHERKVYIQPQLFIPN